jgi:hypothetical protein
MWMECLWPTCGESESEVENQVEIEFEAQVEGSLPDNSFQRMLVRPLGRWMSVW